MDIFYEIKPLMAFLTSKRGGQFSIGFVPTMGALHEGHLELIKASRSQNNLTVCSIYVNPTQFNNAQDLEKYPRTLDADKEKLEKAGCDVIFAPDNEQMYKGQNDFRFDVGEIGSVLEGEFRLGHFSGVAQVVCKLFNIVQPNRAYFGQKDFQQYKVIEKLVDELHFDIQLTSVPIFRERSGLAMSSRNQRLNENEKANAVVFYQSLLMASELLKKGEQFIIVKGKVKQMCEATPNVKLEYMEWVDTKNLKPVQNVSSRSVLLIAGYVGDVRLIDNLLLE
ncbi:MAG: pantoate--beta-alanine ligase [Cyclobacteriaceae bacterium]|nr:pantoate--beta-alanine ligase [Cyclobacteriaceae bacterium]